MSAPPIVADPRTRLDAYLHERGLAEASRHVESLTPDASDRRYFRVRLDGGRSIVLAVYASPIAFDDFPFANVAHLLERMPVPVPSILGHSDAHGVVALQDLGDTTLQAHLESTDLSDRAARYREAVAILAVLQERGRELASSDYTPYGLAFDVEKLTFELDFFTTHFLQAFRGVELRPSERDALAHEWRVIVEELSSEPRVLCHRDYHSRNLMLHDGRLHLIDFQDARLGPDTYDLASLLRDSYVELEDDERETLVDEFLRLTGSTGGDASEFRRRFDLMSVQRNLKALGTFGYQATSRQNPVYAQYVPRTLGYVKRNLERYPRFAGLRALLSAHVDELG